MAGLYLHIPFCHSKCSYCDFYSGLRPNAVEEYIDALIAELSMRSNEIAEPFTTIYIGGGTPSILPVEELIRLIDGINAIVETSKVEEFTIEANPEDIDREKLRSYRQLGINRVSIGVQSFNDNLLKSINRRHSADQAMNVIRCLKDDAWNFSIDLMFGLPNQTIDDWRNDVATLIQILPPHFSAYLLSYEPGTRLYAMLQAGKVEETPEYLADEMQQIITTAAQENGYNHYEISNYSLQERHSRHNSAYWTMTPYLGLGASAHSFDGDVRRINPADIKKYLNAIRNGNIVATIEPETLDERFNDYIITGLRTLNGLSLEILKQHFPAKYVDEMLKEAKPLIASEQLVVTADNRLYIPQCHWLKSDAIMRDLLRI